VFKLTRASFPELEAILAAAREASPSYTEVGATRHPGGFPAGYRHDYDELSMVGPKSFEYAKEGLRTWQVHIGAGAEVFPTNLGTGETVIVVLGFGPFQILAPCRIIYVIDEADTFGFAYGTLPGHPETGEEAFTVEREGRTETRFRIRSFSRPAELLVRAGGPVARIVQRRATQHYLQGMADCVNFAAPVN